MQKKIKFAFAAVVVLLVMLVGGFYIKLNSYLNSPNYVAGEVFVTIPQGASPQKLADLLADKGLASWKLGVRLGFRLFMPQAGLKAGTYRFAGSPTLLQIFDDIAKGRIYLVEITIPEGYTGYLMAKEFERLGITSEREFLRLVYDKSSPAKFGVPGPTLEGYLFPDTYRFAPGQPAEKVVGHLVERFMQVAKGLSPSLRAGGYDLKSWVTLASIIEKETGRGEERPLIASVFLNRLKKGMMLQSDPTVIYGLLPNFNGNITRADLTRLSPYNTYVIKGIPAGPIANPGKDSLSAVLNPAKSGYFYFVSKNNGSHHFSASYAEHSNAVRQYQLGKR